ncbi:MAG: class B sortase [Clostridia bacterium]|nr:class B sortase [Clostridia bacterium]
MMFVSASVIWSELRARQIAREELQQLQEIVSRMPETASEGTETTLPVAETLTDDTGPERIPKRNLLPLFSRNEDCIGWVHIQDTAVDYPVMHTPEEPQKYLRLNFDKEFSYAGIPFMDARCTQESSHLILYGHNMKDGTMFSDILQYVEYSYYTEHPVIEFETAAGCMEYRIFAVVFAKQTDSWFRFIEEEDEKTFRERIRQLQDAALYDTGVQPVYGSQCLTLSTCDNRDDSIRFLVIAFAA